jgi:hypothetical protein
MPSKMGKGDHLCEHTRNQIYRYGVEQQKSAEEFHGLVFFHDNSDCTLKRLDDIVRMFHRGDEDEISNYLEIRSPRMGNARPTRHQVTSYGALSL